MLWRWTIGVYKLMMEFGKVTKVMTKVDIGPWEILCAARIMDCTLNHYLQAAEYNNVWQQNIMYKMC